MTKDKDWIWLLLFFAIVSTSIPHDLQKSKMEKVMGVPIGTAEVGMVLHRTTKAQQNNKWFMRSQIKQTDRRNDWSEFYRLRVDWSKPVMSMDGKIIDRHQKIESLSDFRYYTFMIIGTIPMFLLFIALFI